MEEIKDKAYDDELNKSEEEIGETPKRRKSVNTLPPPRYCGKLLNDINAISTISHDYFLQQ